MAPIYTNFEGERAPKNAFSFVKIFQKVPKNGFFGLFFQKTACGAENLARTGSFHCLGRAWKINLIDLKKGRPNFRKFFENPPSPRENPRSAPAVDHRHNYTKVSPLRSPTNFKKGIFSKKIAKNRSKKPFLGTFWKILTKKRVFWRALPLKISIYWRQRRL